MGPVSVAQPRVPAVERDRGPQQTRLPNLKTIPFMHAVVTRIPTDVRRLLLAAASCVFLATGTGCREDSSPGGAAGGSANTRTASQRCDDLVAGVLSMVRPENLEISSSPEDVARQLNQWYVSCGGADAGDAAHPFPEGDWQRLLTAQQRRALTLPKFAVRDAQDIRDSLLERRTLDFALRSAGDDLQRAVELFHYVVRNVALNDSEAEKLPLTPFHVVLFGRGTAEDRAWVYARLLRQLGIDAVILRPSSNDSSAKQRWLLAVLLKGEAYLFDPGLGSPLPSARDDLTAAVVQMPATLAEVLAHPELLDPYAPAQEASGSGGWSSPRVELIGETAHWSRRREELQLALPAGEAVVISGRLAELHERVVSAGQGRWTAENVSIWGYPDSRWDALGQLSDTDADRFGLMRLPFAAPIEVERDPETRQERVLPPQRIQFRTRLKQVLGDYDEAVRAYMLIRSRRQLPPQVLALIPADSREAYAYMHARASHDAFFWAGVCQLEQGDFAAASDTFRSFLEKNRGSPWTAHCLELLALCQFQQGHLTDAVATLESVPAADPARPGADLLIRRWRKRLERPA